MTGKAPTVAPALVQATGGVSEGKIGGGDSAVLSLEAIAKRERGLVMDRESRSALMSSVMEKVHSYLDGLAESAAVDMAGSEEAATALRVREAPEEGMGLESALDIVFSKEALKGFNTAGPSYLAHVPGGGMFSSAVGGLIANCLNRFTGVWEAAPGLVQLEVNVIRWICDMVGYSEAALGTLTSGGSMANFGGVFTAKEELLDEGEVLSVAIYVSEQINHSVCKAIRLAGFPSSSIRSIPTDDRCRMRMDILKAEIAADKEGKDGKEKKRPFLIIASGGTTHTGAVDPLDSLADLAAAEGMWLHVDACYGGFFRLTERGKVELSGLGRANSIALDPHKSMFVPFGTGALLVKDGEALKRAHFLGAEYMPEDNLQGPDQVDFAQMSSELSRDYRGLRVWLPLMVHGLGKFRQELDTKLDLCQWMVAELRGIPGLEIPLCPQLSVLVFRFIGAAKRCEEEANETNRQLLELINEKGTVHLSGVTLFSGAFYLRICILNFRTDSQLICSAVADVRAACEALSGKKEQ